jgi:hypothetical protein
MGSSAIVNKGQAMADFLTAGSENELPQIPAGFARRRIPA